MILYNYIQTLKWRKLYLESLQFQVLIAKNVSITCLFNQHELFKSFIHSSLSSMFEYS